MIKAIILATHTDKDKGSFLATQRLYQDDDGSVQQLQWHKCSMLGWTLGEHTEHHNHCCIYYILHVYTLSSCSHKTILPSVTSAYNMALYFTMTAEDIEGLRVTHTKQLVTLLLKAPSSRECFPGRSLTLWGTFISSHRDEFWSAAKSNITVSHICGIYV